MIKNIQQSTINRVCYIFLIFLLLTKLSEGNVFRIVLGTVFFFIHEWQSKKFYKKSEKVKNDQMCRSECLKTTHSSHAGIFTFLIFYIKFSLYHHHMSHFPHNCGRAKIYLKTIIIDMEEMRRGADAQALSAPLLYLLHIQYYNL